MRITYVIDSLRQGGAEKSLVTMVGPLVSLGVEAEIVVIDEGTDLVQEAEATGAEVVQLGGRASLSDSALGVSRHLRRTRPDLVHTTLFRANMAGRAAGTVARVPVVSSLVNTPYGRSHMEEPGIRPSRVRMAQTIDAASCRLVRRFHANAAHVAETMSARLHIPRQKIDVIPRGRSRSELGLPGPRRGAEIRSGLAVGNRALVVAIAREEHQKGLDVLVDAAAMVRHDVVVAIAGRAGHASEELRRRVRAAGAEGSIVFLGFRDDVPDLLCAADVLALPSRREGLPGVVLEAMALDTPVVATDLPGVREALGPDGGSLVPVDDAPKLAAALDAVLDDPATARRRSAAARHRFEEHFTVEAVTDQMLRFYDRALRR